MGPIFTPEFFDSNVVYLFCGDDDFQFVEEYQEDHVQDGKVMHKKGQKITDNKDKAGNPIPGKCLL